MNSPKQWRCWCRGTRFVPCALGVYAIVLASLAGCRKDGALPKRSSMKTDLYAEESTCESCHAALAEKHRHSAHGLTSSFPTAETMKGHFHGKEASLSTSNPNLAFRMDERDGRYFQKALFTTPARTYERSERIALAIGSGRKGQTYLFWDQDKLFELPLSWWVASGEWMNSPGYPEGTANFDRGVSHRCMECHATSFETSGEAPHGYNPATMIPGISCQKCHGPALEHVRWEQTHQGPPPTGFGVVNPARLSRERQMDLCALCHGGVGKALRPPLSYRPGEVLATSLVLKPPSPATPIDPHGSQLQTLESSRCFLESGTLTCTTCHDVHETRRDPKDFASRCLSCHDVSSCGEYKTQGESLRAECVNCHMPLLPTAKIIMRLNGERHQPSVRTHRIGIYPKATVQQSSITAPSASDAQK